MFTGKKPKKPPLGWLGAGVQGLELVAGLRPAKDALKGVNPVPPLAGSAARHASMRLFFGSPAPPAETVNGIGVCTSGFPME